MVALAVPKPPLSVDDYLKGEQQSDLRHEYIDGAVYAMVGASDRHALIVNALAFALTPAARRQQCQLFTSDMKLRLEIGNQTCFYYPDLLVSCDPNDRERYYRKHPCLIVEVLSESTERIDRREKLLAYQTLPSLSAYLLVEQDQRLATIYRRDCGWKGEQIVDGAIAIDCLEENLSLDAIYADV